MNQTKLREKNTKDTNKNQSSNLSGYSDSKIINNGLHTNITEDGKSSNSKDNNKTNLNWVNSKKTLKENSNADKASDKSLSVKSNNRHINNLQNNHNWNYNYSNTYSSPDPTPLMEKKIFYMNERIKDEESAVIEFKRYSYPFNEEMIRTLQKTILSFVNSDGGCIFIGIRDDSVVKGIQLIGKEKDDSSNFLVNITDNISPSIKFNLITVEFFKIFNRPNRYLDSISIDPRFICEVNNMYIIKILVKKGDSDILYSLSNYNISIFKRLGSQCLKMTHLDVLNELKFRILKSKTIDQINNIPTFSNEFLEDSKVNNFEKIKSNEPISVANSKLSNQLTNCSSEVNNSRNFDVMSTNSINSNKNDSKKKILNFPKLIEKDFWKEDKNKKLEIIGEDRINESILSSIKGNEILNQKNILSEIPKEKSFDSLVEIKKLKKIINIKNKGNLLKNKLESKKIIVENLLDTTEDSIKIVNNKNIKSQNNPNKDISGEKNYSNLLTKKIKPKVVENKIKKAVNKDKQLKIIDFVEKKQTSQKNKITLDLKEKSSSDSCSGSMTSLSLNISNNKDNEFIDSIEIESINIDLGEYLAETPALKKKINKRNKLK